MPRLVVSRKVGQGEFRSATSPGSGTPPPTQPDTYKDRLVKYIPAESLAFYAFADKLIATKYKIAAGATLPTVDAPINAIAWGLLILGVVFTPIYMWKSRQPDQPWGLHAAISTIAFVLWAYTLAGSVFVLYGWYDVFYAALLAPVFTFVAGAFEPKPK